MGIGIGILDFRGRPKVKDPYRVVYDLPDDVDVNVTDDCR